MHHRDKRPSPIGSTRLDRHAINDDMAGRDIMRLDQAENTGQFPFIELPRLIGFDFLGSENQFLLWRGVCPSG